MSKIINENQSIKYRVIVDKNVLLETASLHAAEQFVSSLSQDTQKEVIIIPITPDGSQVLLG